MSQRLTAFVQHARSLRHVHLLFFLRTSSHSQAFVLDASGSMLHYGPPSGSYSSSNVPGVKHFVKDMGIALEDAERMGLKLKGLELARDFYERVEDAGFAQKGTQVLLRVLRTMNEPA